MGFGRVLGGFWEVKNLDFHIFFDVVSMLNFERCFESKNLRKKCQKTKVWRLVGPGRRNVRGAGERKREGFRSLLGQNSGKKYFLCKHFRCSDRRKPLPSRFSTLVPGGAADLSAARDPPGQPSFGCGLRAGAWGQFSNWGRTVKVKVWSKKCHSKNNF